MFFLFVVALLVVNGVVRSKEKKMKIYLNFYLMRVIESEIKKLTSNIGAWSLCWRERLFVSTWIMINHESFYQDHQEK